MCKENKIVSIIVPVYNVEDKLKRCVESIRKQTYKDIEIILIKYYYFLSGRFRFN